MKHAMVLLLGFIALLLTVNCKIPHANSSSGGIGFGEWKGDIEGRAYNQSFRLPVSVVIDKPLPYETNQVRLSISAGGSSQVGNLALKSSLEFNAPYSGGKVTLQYFSVRLEGGRLEATLTNGHKAEAAAFNGFTAPNVTAQSAPGGPGQELYKSMGPTEMFAFHEGATIIINLNGNSLTGSVQGKGYSYTGIFPTPDVSYQADFSARRIR